MAEQERLEAAGLVTRTEEEIESDKCDAADMQPNITAHSLTHSRAHTLILKCLELIFQFQYSVSIAQVTCPLTPRQPLVHSPTPSIKIESDSEGEDLVPTKPVKREPTQEELLHITYKDSEAVRSPERAFASA